MAAMKRHPKPQVPGSVAPGVQPKQAVRRAGGSILRLVAPRETTGQSKVVNGGQKPYRVKGDERFHGSILNCRGEENERITHNRSFAREIE